MVGLIADRTMLRTIAAFVETPYYVVAAALIAFIAVFWFALNHEKSLLLPYITSTVLLIAASSALGLFPVFLISIPSMMVGLTIHLWLSAKLSYPLRKIIRRR